MIQCEKATIADAKTLAGISQRAFDPDIHYGAPGPGGPPGYASVGWQRRMMRAGQYYKILLDTQIIGGIIVFWQGDGHYEVGRMFVAPEFQKQGIGTQVFEFLWQEFPDAARWTLETPVWNQRTRHFYKKVGFIEIGLAEHDQVRFEKNV